MDEHRWQRLQRLFEAALDLDPEQRASYLDRSCGDDPTLRRQVESLVIASSDAPGAITGAIGEAAHWADKHDAPAAAGRRIGVYRIERELGQGGMGAVYLAHRADDEYRKQVAIKLMRGSVPGSDAVRRFRDERQILASLDHPGIARLLDGGTTRSGEPYVVMEYIEGEPIDEYCDRRTLSIDDRLRLFRRVCDAVQYAHRNLVVHRDIKPANILVGADGVPKLLDFGIAKLLGPDAEAAARTATGMRLLTPEYASPEQIRGEPITTATDVYSLGVLLFELLAGRRPFRFDSRQPGEAMRAICEQQPERPSTAATGGERNDADSISRNRGSLPDRLRRRLSGDVDVIVLKALRKEPERRYASVEQLAADIGRHLDGLPVTARPDTWRYRTGKFIRRNRVAVAAATAFVLLLAGFGVMMSLQAGRIASERDTARSVADFLVGLFEVADPGEARGNTITARELLDRGAARIAEELRDQPQVRATVMHTMGRVYSNIGLYDEARRLLEQSLASREEQFGDDSLPVAETLTQLAMLNQMLANYDEAERMHRRALAVREARRGRRSAEVAETLAELGAVLRVVGRYDEAEPLLRESVDTRVALLGEQHLDVAASRDKLALLLQARGQGRAAEELFRSALETRRAQLSDSHPAVAESANNLAVLVHELGDLDEAEGLYREVLAIDREIYGDEHVWVAADLNNLAELHKDRGDYDRAESLLLESLAMKRRLLGEVHPDVAFALANLAAVYFYKEDLARSEELDRQALAMRRELFDEDHPQITESISNLAGTLRVQRRLGEAAELLREVAERYERHGGPPGSLAAAKHNLGQILCDLGRTDEGLPLLRRAIELAAETLSPDHAYLGVFRTSLATCLARAGSYEEAERGYLEAREHLVRVLGEDHDRTRETARRLAQLYGLWERPDEAARWTAIVGGDGTTAAD